MAQIAEDRQQATAAVARVIAEMEKPAGERRIESGKESAKESAKSAVEAIETLDSRQASLRRTIARTRSCSFC